MSDVRKWMGVCALALLMACTLGEPPPGTPTTEPGAESVPEARPDEGGEGAGDGEEGARAGDLLVRSQLAYEKADLEEALQLAQRVMAEYPGTQAERPARWVAARSAFALGRYDAAGELSAAYAAGQPSGSSLAVRARELAELAEDARQAPVETAVIGAVLPRTGPRVLVRYADFLLEGIELAVAEAERTQNRRIELVVADDAGGDRVAEAVRELEQRGALAIIGPLLPRHLAAAAHARRDARTVMVSPTATELPTWPEVFSVNARDARGAQELGQYAADVGLRQAALLYPRSPEYQRKAQAFAVEYEMLGGVVRASVPYDSGTTTFGPHMRRILQAVAPIDPTRADSLLADTLYADSALADSVAWRDPRDMAVGTVDADSMTLVADSSDPWHGLPPQEPFALFVAAPQRDVPQIAPQVAFYGLDSAGVQLFGDEAWASAPVRRVVPARDLEGVIAASRYPPGRAGAAADPMFVQAYEERYRRSLGDQELPALAYDAAHLVLQALPSRMLTPAALARRFEYLAGIRGATGLLSVRADRVVRTPYLVMIRRGDVVPAPYPWEYTMPVPTPPLAPDTTPVPTEAQADEGEGQRP